MRVLLAAMVLSGALFVSGCGASACRDNTCYTPPPIRPVAAVYSEPYPAPAPIVDNTPAAFCNPCAGI